MFGIMACCGSSEEDDANKDNGVTTFRYEVLPGMKKPMEEGAVLAVDRHQI